MRHSFSYRRRPAVRRNRPARARRTDLEYLEARVLLSLSETRPSGPVTTDGAGPGEIAPPMILWQGVERPINPGHWILALDGLPGAAAMQLATASQLLQQHTAGPALMSLRSLGGRGSLLAVVYRVSGAGRHKLLRDLGLRLTDCIH
jgi:hypothetical protein